MTAVAAFIIAYSNSDFTNPHELVLIDEPKDCRSDYTHMGVKYTGLETSRHKNTHTNTEQQCFNYQHNEHNWVRIGLKERTVVEQINVSTRFFTGNQIRAISVILEDELTGNKTRVLERVNLSPDSDHSFQIEATIATECYVELYHEGGLTRINFLGEKATTQLETKDNLLEKALISHVSNEHYGHPRMVVKANRTETYMVGWESARTGFGEQAVFHFKAPTLLTEIVVDTYLHRLNAPLSCHVFGLNNTQNEDIDVLIKQKPVWMLTFQCGKQVVPKGFQKYMLEQQFLKEDVDCPDDFQIRLYTPPDSQWQAILPFEALRPDTFHRFKDFSNRGTFTHLLYMHYPNGGVHALKVYS